MWQILLTHGAGTQYPVARLKKKKKKDVFSHLAMINGITDTMSNVLLKCQVEKYPFFFNHFYKRATG